MVSYFLDNPGCGPAINEEQAKNSWNLSFSQMGKKQAV